MNKTLLPAVALLCSLSLTPFLTSTPCVSAAPAPSVPNSSTKLATAAPAGEVEEVRGLWIASYSLLNPKAIHNIVAAAKQHHFNTLFVQVRSRGDALYKSDLEVRAKGLEGQPRDYDPLAAILEEAHQNGLKVHAWLNTFLVWTGKNKPSNPSHLLNRHPDWIARDNKNHYQTIETPTVEGAFLQPSNPAVQEHLYRVFTDVAERYDVDGLHFDFVRYAGSQYDFAGSTLQRFAQYMEPKIGDAGRAAVRADHTRLAYVHIFPKEWADWRRDQVTSVVRRISETVHDRKPWVQVSAAVFANPGDAWVERGQDWRGWLTAGYLDAICPMAYSTDTNVVAKQIAYAIQVAGEKHVYAGIGSWRLSPEDTAKKISRVRALGAKGINIFSYGDVTHDGRSMKYLDALQRSSFASRAGVPPMNWRRRQPEK